MRKIKKISWEEEDAIGLGKGKQLGWKGTAAQDSGRRGLDSQLDRRAQFTARRKGCGSRLKRKVAAHGSETERIGSTTGRCHDLDRGHDLRE